MNKLYLIKFAHLAVGWLLGGVICSLSYFLPPPVQADCHASSLQNCYQSCGGSEACKANCEKQCNEGTLPIPNNPYDPPQPEPQPPIPGDPPQPEPQPQPDNPPQPEPKPPEPDEPQPGNQDGGKGSKHCSNPQLPYYIENNCKAIDQGGENGKISDEKKLARHLIYDGYQAYRTLGQEITFHSYLYDRNEKEVPNFAKATIPFLRNRNYEHQRLNSAENYFGYNASKMMGIANVASPNANDIMVESSYIALSLTSQAQCAFKLMNLFYIYQTCEGGKLAGGQQIKGKNEFSCNGLYYTADGSEWIPLNAEQAQKGAGLSEGYKLKDLVSNIMEKDIGEVKGLQDPVKDRARFCHQLYTTGSKQRQERQKNMDEEQKQKSLPEKDEEKAMTALDNLTFFLSQYRTGYLVQATRICVLEQPDVCAASDPECGGTGKPIFKGEYGASAGCDAWEILTWGDCQWQQMPDQVRVFPFKYADLFSNKNFCNQWDENYPDNCDDSWEKADQYTKDGPVPEPIKTKSGKRVNNFSFVNPLTEYTDPSIHTWLMKWDSNFNTLQKEVVQKGSDKTTKAAYPKDNWTQNEDKMYYQSDKMSRNHMADVVAEAPAHQIGNLKNQINCANSIISGFKPCDWKSKPLEMALAKIINGTADNNAFAEYYLGKRDHDNAPKPTYDITSYWQYAGDAGVSYRNLVSKEIGDTMENQVEAPSSPLPYYDSCDCWRYDPFIGCYISSGTYHPGAVARYWVVIPYGQELMQTEDNLLGSFYSRQHNKSGKGYLEFVADDQRQSKRLAVNDLATEGGTNLPISILGGGPISNIFTVQASLYAKNTRVYQILQGCKDVNQFFLGKCGSEEKPDNPNSQGKSEPSEKEVNKLKAQFTDLSDDEISHALSNYGENATNRLTTYQQNKLSNQQKYAASLNQSTIADVSKNYLTHSGTVLGQIVNLKNSYGEIPGVSEEVIVNLVKTNPSQAGNILRQYAQLQTQFPNLDKAVIMEVGQANLGNLPTATTQLEQIAALQAQFPQFASNTIKDLVTAQAQNAPSNLALLTKLSSQYTNLPQSYLQEFVKTAGDNAENLVTQYLNLSQIYASSINPKYLKEMVVADLANSGTMAANLANLSKAYPQLSADFLAHLAQTQSSEPAAAIAAATAGVLSQYPKKEHRNIYTLALNNPSQIDQSAATYTTQVTKAIASYQNQIQAGLISEAQIKAVIAHDSTNYARIINSWLQGQMSLYSWQTISS